MIGTSTTRVSSVVAVVRKLRITLANNCVLDLLGVVTTNQSPANVSHVLCFVSKAVELSKPDEAKIADSFNASNFSISDVSKENGVDLAWRKAGVLRNLRC